MMDLYTDVLKLASMCAVALMVLAFGGLVLTHSLVTSSIPVILVQCAALALMVWARVTFGTRSFHAAADPTEGGLVTNGPYRFIRHPIYTAACLLGVAGALANGSALALVLGTLLVAGAIGRMLCEETLIARVYPEYRAYAHATKRMIPFVF